MWFIIGCIFPTQILTTFVLLLEWKVPKTSKANRKNLIKVTAIFKYEILQLKFNKKKKSEQISDVSYASC